MYGQRMVTRALVGIGVVSIAAIAVSGSRAVASSMAGGLSAVAVPPQRTIVFTYVARVQGLPLDDRAVEVWIPLAKSSDEQEIVERVVHSPAPYTVTTEPVYGNEMLHLALAPPRPERLDVEIDYRVVIRSGIGERPEPPRTSSAIDLQSEGLMVIDEVVRAMTRQATSGRQALLDQARGIYEYVIRHMTYDKKTPGWGRGDTQRACRVGRGNCTDFHSLFISMTRAAGIPARFKIGATIPRAASGQLPGYHCWAEFYVDGQGWVPVDASEAWKHPEWIDRYFGGRDGTKFLISTGRNLRLAPEQRGPPVNIFITPYVEVGGQEFGGVGVEMRFQELT